MRDVKVVPVGDKCCVSNFADAEDGAVAVDWVVLTAGIVGLAASVQLFINPTVVNGSGQTIEAGFGTAVNTGLTATVGGP
jgi:hypothetical protein